MGFQQGSRYAADNRTPDKVEPVFIQKAVEKKSNAEIKYSFLLSIEASPAVVLDSF